MLTWSTVVQASPEQMSCELAGETTVLHLPASQYYGLGGVATRVWTLLQEARSVEEIARTLLDEYEVDPEVCRADLMQLLQTLHHEGLIEARAVPDAEPAPG